MNHLQFPNFGLFQGNQQLQDNCQDQYPQVKGGVGTVEEIVEDWLPDVEAKAQRQVPRVRTGGERYKRQHLDKSSRVSATLPVTKGLFLCLNSATNGCPTKDIYDLRMLGESL